MQIQFSMFAIVNSRPQEIMRTKTNIIFVFILSTLLLASCGSTLSVMSFNVRQSHAGDRGEKSWDERKDACLEMLKSTKPDLVGVQEAWYIGQLSFFRKNLEQEYGCIGVGRDDGNEKGETTGILYRKSLFELLSSGTFWQSDTPDVPSICFKDQYNCPRPVTWALFRVKKTGRTFYYLNTHMALDTFSQEKGFALIFDWLDSNNKDNIPVILSGDLNMTPVNKVLSPLRERMLDCRVTAPKTDETNTYNAWGNEKKAAIIDYIWITPNLSCKEYRTDISEYGGRKFISDHYPITATIKF